MSYGLSIDGFAYTYGTFSVIASGTVRTGSYTFVTKAQHPDITDWRVVFIPTGLRDAGEEEIRPTLIETSTTLSTSSSSDMSPHRYIVLGR